MVFGGFASLTSGMIVRPYDVLRMRHPIFGLRSIAETARFLVKTEGWISVFWMPTHIMGKRVLHGCVVFGLRDFGREKMGDALAGGIAGVVGALSAVGVDRTLRTTVRNPLLLLTEAFVHYSVQFSLFTPGTSFLWALPASVMAGAVSTPIEELRRRLFLRAESNHGQRAVPTAWNLVREEGIGAFIRGNSKILFRSNTYSRALCAGDL